MWKKPLILAALLATCCASAAEAENVAYATAATVLRSDPSTKAHIVASISKDTELTIGHCTQGWCFAHLGSKTGYVSVSQLDFDNNSPSTTGTVVERTYVYPDYYSGPYVYGPAFYCCGGGWRHGHGGPYYWRH